MTLPSGTPIISELYLEAKVFPVSHLGRPRPSPSEVVDEDVLEERADDHDEGDEVPRLQRRHAAALEAEVGAEEAVEEDEEGEEDAGVAGGMEVHPEGQEGAGHEHDVREELGDEEVVEVAAKGQLHRQTAVVA